MTTGDVALLAFAAGFLLAVGALALAWRRRARGVEKYIRELQGEIGRLQRQYMAERRR